MKRRYFKMVQLAFTAIVIGISLCACAKADIKEDAEEIVSEEADEAEEVQEEVPAEENHGFEGEWQRTNVPTSMEAAVLIEEQTADSFEFTVYAAYFTHEGEYSGTAQVLSDTVAVLESNEYTKDSIFFFLKDGQLKIISDGPGDLGFDMDVTMTGNYTLENPEYTNATILKDTFSKEALQVMNRLLTDEYYESYFLFPVQQGVMKDTVYNYVVNEAGEEVVQNALYSADVPTMEGYGFWLFMDENQEYYFYNETIGYYTTNEECLEIESMPTELSMVLEAEEVTVLEETNETSKIDETGETDETSETN